MTENYIFLGYRVSIPCLPDKYFLTISDAKEYIRDYFFPHCEDINEYVRYNKRTGIIKDELGYELCFLVQEKHYVESLQ